MEISERTWVAVTAIGTAALAVGVPLSIRAARDDAKNRFYAQLDAIYMRIQELIIETPHLGRMGTPRTPDETVQYNAFAFIVWNFIESIFDYGRQDPRLLKDWKCIFLHESQVHRDWFNDAGNRSRFKDKFKECIDEACIR